MSEVLLSQKSQELRLMLNQHLQAFRHDSMSEFCWTAQLPLIEGRINTECLLNWLASEPKIPVDFENKSKQKLEFIITALRTELLADLLVSIETTHAVSMSKVSPSTWFAKLKLVLLTLVGVIFAACEAFDSISTMMGVFSLPSIAILLVGITFSVLSISIFSGYQLIQVAEQFGVRWSDASHLLDLHLRQLNSIKAIRRMINTQVLSELSLTELNDLKTTIAMLQHRFVALKEASRLYHNVLASPLVRITRGIFSAISGVLFFGSGFCAGQSVSTFVLGLFLGGVTSSFWPVILFSVAIGLVAFTLFWFIQRLEINKWISSWFGLDEDKMEKLLNTERLETEENKLDCLHRKITSAGQLANKLDDLQEQLHQSGLVMISPKEDMALMKQEPLKSSIGHNPFAFYPPKPRDSDVIGDGKGLSFLTKT